MDIVIACGTTLTTGRYRVPEVLVDTFWIITNCRYNPIERYQDIDIKMLGGGVDVRGIIPGDLLPRYSSSTAVVLLW